MNPKCVLLSGVVCCSAIAGDLTPPAGPTTPTMKTLVQVEPRTPLGPDTTPGDAEYTYIISESGSYYLSEDLIGEVDKHGIHIIASNVTLDLMGFSVRGPGRGTPRHGIQCTGVNNIVVRNGIITQWDATGFEAGFTSPESRACVIESVTSSYNGEAGITLAQDSVARNCITFSNETYGIHAQSGSRIESCTANENELDGIVALGRCVVLNSLASDNHRMGISVGSNSTVRGSNASSNDSDGIKCSANCVVADNIAASSSTGNGITAGLGCRVENNFCSLNVGHGIVMPGLHSTAIGNQCVSNVLNGIFVTLPCRIIDNDCSNNQVFGISVDASDCEIRGNRVASNGSRGIYVADIRNLIVANVARDNAGVNYQIVAGNRVGPIVIPPLSGSIAGDADSDALGAGTTDPWANLSY